jgi:hypothetical protein
MKPSNPPDLHPNSVDAETASPKKQDESLAVRLDDKTVYVTDSDLLEQAANVQPFMRDAMLRSFARTQLKRNETNARREGMTAIQRRRDVVKETIAENPLDKSDIHHIHSVLALCGLPYKRPADDSLVYRRSYGQMSLTVQAGDLIDPYTGKMQQQGLPYGTKARLLMLHLCTRALRQKSPVIDLENSLSGFIESIGFSKSGGANGTFTLFKEQINRLAACRMQMGLWNGERALTINTSPISSFDVWLPQVRDPNQQMLWNNTITLSQEFYASLQKHALPVDIRALSALSHSAKQMDILLWLAYRLKGLNKSYFLTWDLVKEQFCQSKSRRMIDFQRQFKQDIKDMSEIFSKDIPIQMGEKGVTLKPCDPEGLFVPPEKRLKISKR